MTDGETAGLRARVEAALAGWGPGDAVTVLLVAAGRPAAAVLEIRPFPLEDYPLPERLERMTGLLRAGGLEHRAAPGGEPEARGIEIAQLVRLLREAGINATADADTDTVVVSAGPPPRVSLDQVREVLANKYGPALAPVPDAMALTVWAGIPPEDVERAAPAGDETGTGPARPRSAARAARREPPRSARTGH